jgi:DNA-binding transcriptional regulator YhcF (GntR family)
MAKSYLFTKLYHDILDDYEMATLPDNLWRRMQELEILAHEMNKQGRLPTIEQIGFRLRIMPLGIEQELHQLADMGMVEEEAPDVWVLTGYEERQSPVDSATRQRNYRQRKKQQEASQNVTPNVTTPQLPTVTQPVTKRQTDIEEEEDRDLDLELEEEAEENLFSSSSLPKGFSKNLLSWMPFDAEPDLKKKDLEALATAEIKQVDVEKADHWYQEQHGYAAERMSVLVKPILKEAKQRTNQKPEAEDLSEYIGH